MLNTNFMGCRNKLHFSDVYSPDLTAELSQPANLTLKLQSFHRRRLHWPHLKKLSKTRAEMFTLRDYWFNIDNDIYSGLENSVRTTDQLTTLNFPVLARKDKLKIQFLFYGAIVYTWLTSSKKIILKTPNQIIWFFRILFEHRVYSKGFISTRYILYHE